MPDQVPEPAPTDDETPVMPTVADGARFLSGSGCRLGRPRGCGCGRSLPVPRLQAAAVARVILRYQLAQTDVAQDEVRGDHQSAARTDDEP